MKSLLIILQLALCLTCYGQEEITVACFKTSRDFNLKNKVDKEIIAITSRINSDFIVIKKFLSPATRKKERKLIDSWAIQYDNAYYFNLKYLGNSKLEGKFIKLDFIGKRFCYAYLEDSTLEKLNDKNNLAWVRNFGTSVAALGLGMLDKAISSGYSSWKTKTGTIKKLLFINLGRENYSEKGLYNSLQAIYINKKQVSKMSKQGHSKSEWRRLDFEFAIRTIEKEDQSIID